MVFPLNETRHVGRCNFNVIGPATMEGADPATTAVPQSIAVLKEAWEAAQG
jgi:hypothetical protein